MSEAGIDAVLSRLPWALALNIAMAAAAFLLGTVRVGGAIAGAIVGICVLAFAGWGAFLLLGAFFVLGNLATRWGWSAKESRGVSETNKGARGLSQVLANGVPAAALAVIHAVSGGSEVVMIGLAGALAAAAADTASSEIGQVHGSKPVSMPGLKAVPVGTPGAVSGAGTAAGAGAGAIMGLAACALGVVPLLAVPVVALCAIAAGVVESLLAPALKGSAGHHALNLLNGCVGALGSMGVWKIVF